jgi:SAM-dependent methyltransferase
MVAGDSELQTDVLEDLASAHNYRRWIVDLSKPWLGDNPLEVGSGLGHYAEEWAAAGVRMTASEADRSRLEALYERFHAHPHVEVRELAVPIREEAEHSAVVAINVLEHISDDVEALRAFAGLVRDGGRVVLFVPAFMWALGAFDREIGHFRRYTKVSLRRALEDAGLTVERLHYVNSAGLLAWLLVVRLLGQRPKEGLLLRVFDGLVVPLLRRVESRRRPPFGQSLFAVARTGPGAD